MGFLVSWFLGFLVSKFLGFLFSKLSKFQRSNIPYYQISISCFLIGIDFISKIFKILLDGSSGFSAPVFSHTFHFFEIHNFEICDFLSNMIWHFSWICWGFWVSPKINNIGFGARGHVRQSRNIIEMGFVWFFHKQLEKL